MQARVIVVVANKGGIGKSTIAQNLAVLFARYGKKTLLVDLDPSGNTTKTMTEKMPSEWEGRSLFDLTRSIDLAQSMGLDLHNFIQNTRVKRLDIIPGNNFSNQLHAEYAMRAKNRGKPEYHFFKETIKPFFEDYDIILVDTPPSNEDLTKAAMFAATDILLPMVSGTYAQDGFLTSLTLKEQMEAAENIKINALGIVFNMVDGRLNLQRAYREMYDDSEFHDLVLRTGIRRAQATADAVEFNRTVVEYEPKSNSAIDFMMLYREIRKRMEATDGKQ